MDIDNKYINLIGNSVHSLENNNKKSINNNKFSTILDSKIKKKLAFSKHADCRIKMRGINMTKSQIARLEEGVEKARRKGIKESLILIDSTAFIVNIKNNIVITAVENEEKIFTNIDGSVII